MNLDKKKITNNSRKSPRPIVVNGAAFEVLQKNIYLSWPNQLGW